VIERQLVDQRLTIRRGGKSGYACCGSLILTQITGNGYYLPRSVVPIPRDLSGRLAAR
jgi:hypothetical protein